MEAQIIADLNDARIRRRGLSCDVPLYPANLDVILKPIKRVKKECIEKNIWLWIGDTTEPLTAQQKTLVQYIDHLVDGKSEQQTEPALTFLGNSNQPIITIQKTKILMI